MITTVLFDLEGTLVDVTAIDHYREARNWRAYAENSGLTRLYPGVAELVGELRARSIRWAVVTNIVSNAAQALLLQHDLAPDALVCFHDVPRGKAKPAPDMCLKALEQLGVTSEAAIGVGDGDRDATSFTEAGVRGHCAAWNERANRGATWTSRLAHPSEVLKLVGR